MNRKPREAKKVNKLRVFMEHRTVILEVADDFMFPPFVTDAGLMVVKGLDSECVFQWNLVQHIELLYSGTVAKDTVVTE